MPSNGSSQTPATARKRARCQIIATGSLSLLSVPKLKAGDQVPKVEVAKAAGALHSRSAVQQKPQDSQEPAKRSQTKAAVAPTGKENLPAGVSSLATVVSHKAGTSASLPQPDIKQPGQAKSAANKLQQEQVYSKAAAASANLPKKDSPHVELQAARDVISASHTVSAKQCAARHADGACTVTGATDTAQAASDQHASTAEPATIAASSTSHANAYNVEDQQDQLGQADAPLACHTAINKRRYRSCCYSFPHNHTGTHFSARIQ